MTEVTANIDWINDLKSFVVAIIERNHQNPREQQPILGICFGAQIIAEGYRPGSVRFLEDPEFGVSRIVLDEPNHRLFTGFNSEFSAYSFHYNQIWSDDLRILDKHNHMGHEFLQAFEVPRSSAFGVQFHPEFNYEQMIKLFETYEQTISEFGFDLRPVISNLDKLKGNENLLKNFFEGYCSTGSK